MYCGKSTRDDINVINSRMINKGVDKNCNKLQLPQDMTDVFYACATNEERNSVTTLLFKNLVESEVEKNNRKNNNEGLISVVIIEAALYDVNSNQRCGKEFEQAIFNNCSDANISSGRNKKLILHYSFIQGYL